MKTTAWLIVSALAFLIPAGAVMGQCDPQVIGAFGGEAHDVEISGTIAYVATGPAFPYPAMPRGSVFAVDISDPSAPSFVGSVRVPHARAIDVDGDIACVATDEGVIVVDVSNPSDLTDRGTVDTGDTRGVDVAGEFAYAASPATGLHIMDISDPDRPVIVGAAAIPDAIDVLVVDEIAYVGALEAGLQLFDVSDPSDPILLSTFLPEPGGRTGNVEIDGTVAYVANGSPGIQIVDVTEPSNPTLITAFDPGSVSTVELQGDIAFFGGGLGGGVDVLFIVDISDPASPIPLDEVLTPNLVQGVAVSGTTAYVANEYAGLVLIDVANPTNGFIRRILGTFVTGKVVMYGAIACIPHDPEPGSGDTGTLHLVDMSDPLHPVFLSTFFFLDSNPLDLTIAGSRAYVTIGSSPTGLSIIDISDPALPQMLGLIEGFFVGVAVSSETLYVSTNTSQFLVYDVSDPAAPALLGSTTATRGSVELGSGYAYVGGDELEVIDISDPAKPVVVGSVALPGISGAEEILLNDQVIYATAKYETLSMVDVSDPADPTVFQSYGLGSMTRLIDLGIVDNHLYLTKNHQLEGVFRLRVYDLTNPLSPQWAAETAVGAASYGYPGSMGFWNGFAFIAGVDTGLQILDISSCQTPAAPLADFSMIFGSHLTGALADLEDSDDSYINTRSQFGFSALEPNIAELLIGADGSQFSGSGTLDIEIESRINNPGGSATVRLRNWNSKVLETIHTYGVGQTDAIESIDGIDPTDRIRSADGRIETSIRHAVVATFAAKGFESYFDLVSIRSE